MRYAVFVNLFLRKMFRHDADLDSLRRYIRFLEDSGMARPIPGLAQG